MRPRKGAQVNIPFLSILEPSAQEPGSEMIFGEKAASAGREFTLLLEAFRAGTAFAHGKDPARGGDTATGPESARDSLTTGLDRERPGDGRSGLDWAFNASAGAATITRPALFTGHESSGGYGPAPDAVSLDENTPAGAMPAFHGGSTGSEGGGPESGAVNTEPADAPGLDGNIAPDGMDAPESGHAVFYADKLPAANAPKTDGAQIEAAFNRVQQEPHNQRPAANVAGPAPQDSGEENELPGSTAHSKVNAGHAMPFEPDAEIEDAAFRRAPDTESEISTDRASAAIAPRNRYTTPALGEIAGEIPQKAPPSDEFLPVKDLKGTGLKPVSNTELSGDADSAGKEAFDEKTVAEGYSARGPLRAGNPDNGRGPAFIPSHGNASFAAGNEGQGSFAPAPGGTADDFSDDAHARGGAETGRVDAGREFSGMNAGEAGSRSAFSEGENGREHAAPQSERPAAGVLSATSFRNMVEPTLTARSPDPLSYAADIEKQLDAAVRISVRHNGGEVRIKLCPEHLGELAIKLNINNGAVTAEITAESHEAKALLDAGSSMLKDSLAQQGLTLRECVVGVSSRAEGGLPERRDALYEERRDDTRGNDNDGKNGRKSGYGGGNRGDGSSRPAYGGIDLFA